jgi:hypothetical protein
MNLAKKKSGVDANFSQKIWLIGWCNSFQQAALPQEALSSNMAFHLMFYYIG